MKIILGKYAGFCFGVKNALNICHEARERFSDSEIFTLGPLVHNKKVILNLEKMKIFSTQEIKKNSVMISRAHGISKKQKEKLIKNKNEVIDATCPFVKKIHKVVEENINKKLEVVIFGEKDHPEIKAILEDFPSLQVSKNPDFIESKKEAVLVSQSTEEEVNFFSFARELQKKCKKLKIKNTICEATKKRQKECEEIAKKVDKMIVIGGKNSNNSRKLYEISSNFMETFFIENESEINLDDFIGVKKLGIMAGASTPEESIRKVFDLMNISLR